jgi:AcrR family transcriptional regulator
MASRRRRSRNGSPAATIDAPADGAAADVVRRAPFADNPRVGARGQRTQQRILDAALEVFGAEGYHQGSIDPIAKRAGCSRAAFYQYFSSKEDVFRHLTGQVARQLNASTEALEPLTASEAGWLALRAWVARHADIYDRYEPVFHSFPAASESDDAVAAGSARWGARTVSRIRARIVGTALRPRELDPVILSLLECVSRTHDMARILRSAGAGPFAEARIGDALADVIHRSWFGLRADVNVHPPPRQRPPLLHFDPALRDLFAQTEAPPELTAAGRRTREVLMEAGRKVFVERGFHGTHVSDLVEAAGVSRGAFYRYFESKDELARTLAARAMRTVSRVLAEIPALAATDGTSGRTVLRRWLRRYNVAQAHEAATLRVWVDAALQDATLRASSAPALDWGRRVMAAFLERRGFGDVDAESLVMVALVSSFGAKERAAEEIDAAAHIIEQGLLGLGGR